MQLFAARGVEVSPHHALPVIFDAEWVEADQHAGALFHRSWLTSLADADESALRFDHDDVGRLVDHRLALPAAGVTRVCEVADGFDLVFRQSERRQPPRAQHSRPGSGQTAQKTAAGREARMREGVIRDHRCVGIIFECAGAAAIEGISNISVATVGAS